MSKYENHKEVLYKERCSELAVCHLLLCCNYLLGISRHYPWHVMFHRSTLTGFKISETTTKLNYAQDVSDSFV